MKPGWILDLVMLDDLTAITIFKFLTFAIMHSTKDKIFGFIIVIVGLEFRISTGFKRQQTFHEVAES